jgi:hypothetical protein
MYLRLGADGEAEEEDPGGGDAGLNRVRYRYRLLPHIIAARFDHWSRCSTDPAIPQIAGWSRRRRVWSGLFRSPRGRLRGGVGCALAWIARCIPCGLGAAAAGRLSPLRTSLPSPVIRVNAHAFCQPSDSPQKFVAFVRGQGHGEDSSLACLPPFGRSIFFAWPLEPACTTQPQAGYRI